ncbi:YebC/PmpR family DNA-binding transcriptional regulator [Desulfitibacter alkalitolerans]|uniref:YebC/PmpR family DNA-binding transcriptional regulator n=1 Tax=Desulfitibacter alkalitolerans TaxID=264641 RepID=UPI0004826AB0|nr:YebC/PmpR family DNA-binding transcriptional regulator [Desulfitibacter alkalitolerans]
MAGHSKWANIKHRKAKMDAQKGKVFTKIARELMVAAKHGGSDPEGNSALKLVIQKAKEANMPNDNIQRAIQKGSGNAEGVNYEETRYEGYGPGGIAVLMRILTDNRNRTAGEIRYIFSKNGGNLGETGCVAWIFESKGLISFDMGSRDEDELMMLLIEAGADDFTIEDGIVEVVTDVESFSTVKEKLEAEKINFNVSEVTMLPQNTVTINDLETASQIIKLMDLLEDHDDVQAVYANYDISDEIMSKM